MTSQPTRPLRLTAAGAVLLAFTVAFALFMASAVHRASDPAGLLRVVGGITGTLGALSFVLIVLGIARRRTTCR